MKRYLVYTERYSGAVGLWEHQVTAESVEINQSGVLLFIGIDGNIVRAFGRGKWIHFAQE